MNIAIDLQPLYSWHRSRGIGNYVKCHIQKILECDSENSYYLINFYGDIPVSEKLEFNSNTIELNFYEKSKEHLKFIAHPKNRAYFHNLVTDIIDKYDIDLYHITAAVDEYEIYDKDFFSKTKVITTVYDLIPLIFPANYLTDYDYPDKYRRALEQYIYADYILADSECAKKDVIDYLNVDKNRITAIMSGVDEKIGHLQYTEYEKIKYKNKFKINTEYLIFVGADDFRKNLHNTVTAFSKFIKKSNYKYQLVIVCGMSEKTRSELYEIAKCEGCLDSIIITGYVSDKDMLFLLNNAYWSLFPSLYEGFGLPIVEAWKCNIPVITSNNSSLGEIAGNAAITVDANNIESIEEGIRFALEEADYDKYVAMGQQEVKKYNWECVAKDTFNAYKQAYEKEKNLLKIAIFKNKSHKLKKRCLAYFPLRKKIYKYLFLNK